MQYKIIRYGYGDSFNDIIIDNNNIIKKSKNSYGDVKISNEINFYNYIETNKIKFSIPKIIEFGENFYVMEYLSNTVPLYKYLQNKECDYVYKFINKI